jgi:hypothetical protein
VTTKAPFVEPEITAESQLKPSDDRFTMMAMIGGSGSIADAGDGIDGTDFPDTID